MLSPRASARIVTKRVSFGELVFWPRAIDASLLDPALRAELSRRSRNLLGCGKFLEGAERKSIEGATLILRHHFASEFVRANVNLKIVAEWLGHTTLTMASWYCHVAGDVDLLLGTVQQALEARSVATRALKGKRRCRVSISNRPFMNAPNHVNVDEVV